MLLGFLLLATISILLLLENVIVIQLLRHALALLQEIHEPGSIYGSDFEATEINYNTRREWWG